MTPESPDYEQLKSRVVSLAEKNERLATALGQARERLAAMQQQLDQGLQPPHQVAVFTGMHAGNACVTLQGRNLEVGVHPSVKASQLRLGQRVLLDERQVLTGLARPVPGGEVVTVVEVVDDQRVLVQNSGMAQQIVFIAPELNPANLQVGDTLRADLRGGVAEEKLVRRDVEQMLAPQNPNVSWDEIAGLENQIEKIRDAVELPFQRPELYRKFDLEPPRGILLFGPPGCGKTLIAKAVATSLGKAGAPSCFLSVKGPELLNKFVGETERHIRAIFARARKLASHDIPVVVFFDEMEALFRTRGTGVSSDVETTVVPQLLAEIDGVEALENVIIIGASNREDMIDPAVLRSGRLDVRVHVGRPDEAAARQILRLGLSDSTPLEAAVDNPGQTLDVLCENTARQVYRRGPETVIAWAEHSDGSASPIYLVDIVSGAMLAAIARRAKVYAIKRAADHSQAGLNEADLRRAVLAEVESSRLVLGTINPAEWDRINGCLPGEVCALRPVKKASEGKENDG